MLMIERVPKLLLLWMSSGSPRCPLLVCSSRYCNILLARPDNCTMMDGRGDQLCRSNICKHWLEQQYATKLTVVLLRERERIWIRERSCEVVTWQISPRHSCQSLFLPLSPTCTDRKTHTPTRAAADYYQALELHRTGPDITGRPIRSPNVHRGPEISQLAMLIVLGWVRMGDVDTEMLVSCY